MDKNEFFKNFIAKNPFKSESDMKHYFLMHSAVWDILDDLQMSEKDFLNMPAEKSLSTIIPLLFLKQNMVVQRMDTIMKTLLEVLDTSGINATYIMAQTMLPFSSIQFSEKENNSEEYRILKLNLYPYLMKYDDGTDYIQLQPFRSADEIIRIVEVMLKAL